MRKFWDFIQGVTQVLVAAGAIALFAMGQKIAAQEIRIENLETTITTVSAKLDKVAEDTAYIRGRLEKP